MIIWPLTPYDHLIPDKLKLHASDDGFFLPKDMCDDMDVTGAALRELVNHSKKFGLEKFEIPGKIKVT